MIAGLSAWFVVIGAWALFWGWSAARFHPAMTDHNPGGRDAALMALSGALIAAAALWRFLTRQTRQERRNSRGWRAWRATEEAQSIEERLLSWEEPDDLAGYVDPEGSG